MSCEHDRALRDPGETRVLPHLRQLDGVRAIAIWLVLLHHLLPRLDYLPPLGVTGVGLFFVLSGFLITRILLQCRLEHERDSISRKTLLGRFYARRALRILPLYYLALTVLAIFNVTHIRQRIWWHAAYLSNVYFSLIDISNAARERHFWSLAVEEQFYLIWPWLILFVRRRHLRWVVLATIILGPAWRIAQPIHLRGSQGNAWLTPPCADLLGMGALLAMCSVSGFGLLGARKLLLRIGLFIGVPMLLLFWVLHPLGIATHLRDRALYAATALAGAWLVGRAADGFSGLSGRCLGCPAMVYTGRISYGLYVWHPFVAGAIVGIIGAGVVKGWAMFPCAIAGSYAVATVSWYAFEGPINALKRFFEYDVRRSGSADGADEGAAKPRCNFIASGG